MRRADDMPLDPEIAAELDVIDATLDGDPVAPAYAELAELVLLVADERPRPEPAFAERLDARAAARFATRRGRSAPDADGASAGARPRWRRALVPAAGALGALAAVAIAVVLVSAGGSSPTRSPMFAAPTSAESSSGGSAGAGASSGGSAGAGASSAGSAGVKAPSPGAAGAAASSAASVAAPSPAATGSAVVRPVPNGRKIVQSAQLSLTTPSAHVDDVAQEVFDAVGLAGGIVNSSTVTATSGSDGYAQFQLSIPSSGLPQAMAALSKLRYASVASRTDTSQDVNDQYQVTVRQLADARALRTALLRQLAGATTDQQIASLKAQIRDAEASIASDEAGLRALNRRIAYSQVSLSVNAAAVPPVPVSTTHGFTIGGAWHDAGRILAVAAGVAIVTLAALVPVALVVALVLWVGALIRRHRREQALDLA